MTARRASYVALTLAGLALPLLMAGCSNDSETSSTSPTPSVSSTSTPTTPATPTTPPEPEPQPLDPFDWVSTPRYGQPVDIRRYRGGYLGLETQGIARLDSRGRELWHWTPVTRDDLGTFLVGDVPFAEPTVRGGLHELIALDPDTGLQLWSTPSNGYSVGDGSRVFVTTCTGEVQDDSSGVCTMTAHDARTGDVLWTNALGTYTENTSLMADRIVVQAFRDDNSSFLTIDPVTGTVLDDDIADEEDDYFLWAVGDAADRRLARTSEDRDARDGCTHTVTIYDVDGTRLWSQDLPPGRKRYQRGACDEYYVYDAEGDVAVSGINSPAYLLDGRTGEVKWRTRDHVSVQAAAAGVLVVSPDDHDGPAAVALDLRTGRQRWTYPDITGGWSAAGSYLYANTSSSCPQVTACSVVLDARTGTEVMRVEGVPQVVLPPAAPGGLPQLMTRVELGEFYTTRFGLVTLPRLPRGTGGSAAAR